MSVLRTFLGTFATKGAGFVTTFVVGVIVSRVLGPAGKGEVDVLVMIASVLVLVAYPSLEEPQLLRLGRERRPPGAFFVNGLLAALIFGGLTVAAFELLVRWQPELFTYRDRVTGEMLPIDLTLLRRLLWVTPLVIAHRLVGGLLQGLKAMTAFNLNFLAQGFVLLGAILVLVLALGGGVEAAVTAHVLSLGAAGLAAIFQAARHPEVRAGPMRFEPRLLGALFFDGLRLHGGVIAAFIIISSDQLVLNRFHGPAAVGVYALAVALTGHLRRLILQPTKEVVGSRLPELVTRPRYFAESLARTSRHVIVLTLLPGLGLMLFGLPFLFLVYGDDFTGAYAPLLVLVPGSLFWAVAVILAYWLIGHGRFLTLTFTGVLMAGLNLWLNFRYVPEHGMMAAAWSSSACYFLHMTIMLVMTCRGARRPPSDFLLPRREDLGIYADLVGKIGKRS